jgi:hypothetical protein
MLPDQAAMTAALLARGLPADRILALHGRLDRPLGTAFLQAAAGEPRDGTTARSSSTSSSRATRQRRSVANQCRGGSQEIRVRLTVRSIDVSSC